MKKNIVSIDSSCLIALQTDKKLKKMIINLLKEKWEGYCTEMAILETFYILCRKLSLKTALEKINALKESKIINLKSIGFVLNEAAEIKCERAIAIADCITIALAQKLQGKAVFYRAEKEIIKTIEKKPFKTEIIFLDQLK
jgi:predicted nucleic acid-binding protein